MTNAILRKARFLDALVAQSAKISRADYDEVIEAVNIQERQIYGLTFDSRQVKAGFLFAAFDGKNHNGADYIAQAIANGATAIMTSTQSQTAPDSQIAPDFQIAPDLLAGVAHIQASNPRRAFALMARQFYLGSFPKTRQPKTRQPMMVAVTGTNGKTSIAHFARHIWRSLGFKAASIGTLGLDMDRHHRATSLTTPSSVDIARILASLTRNHYDYAIFEASSHGLSQYRLDGFSWRAGIFTYLGSDHMDEHGNQANYFNAKAQLIKAVLPKKSLFICYDQAPFALDMLALAKQRGLEILTITHQETGTHQKISDFGKSIHIHQWQEGDDGQKIELVYNQQIYHIDFPLIGRFQAMNALLAALCVLGLDKALSPDKVFQSLSSLRPLNGRLEKIGESQSAPIYIDYAHSPDALKSALSALRLQVAPQRRLILVFGAGGDRDHAKRTSMGQVAHHYADFAIITDDNPRFEDDSQIRLALHKSCPNALNIGDRAKAIHKAIGLLTKGDVLLIAGKGHELYQERRGVRHAFSDRLVVEEALKK